MESRRMAAVLAALCLSALGACGGGGGGDGRSNSNPTAISLSTNTVSASAGYGDYAPTAYLSITVTDIPAAGLYVVYETEGRGVVSLDFSDILGIQADIAVQFRSPIELPVGTVTDTVKLHVCLDDQCARPVRGSPATFTASYTVTDSSTVTLTTPSVGVTGSTVDAGPPHASATIELTNHGNRPPTAMLAQSYQTIESIESITSPGGNPSILDVPLNFRSPTYVGAGVHTEDVVLRVCYDTNCVREIPGSPLTLQVTYAVDSNVPLEPGVPPLPYSTRTPLTHDVIDAEYSAALDAIVMVASTPRSALYLYEVRTGNERELPLDKPPIAVSVAPDGLSAAVGHDALITYVNLATLGQGAPPPVLLNVSTVVSDIVLDGRGYVHALPAADQTENVRSVEIATNTETPGTGYIHAAARGKLHPSGDYMYTADNGLTPSGITKWDLRNGPATQLYDSPYHGDYEMCGDLWLKQDGETIYTKCGNTFRSATTQSEDMVYSGRLQLSTSAYHYGYRILSLSESDAAHEIMLLEEDWFECQSSSGLRCYSHLALYESDLLNRSALYSLPPMELAGTTYEQRGSFVFHRADGQHRYLISRLIGVPDVTEPTYLTVVQ